MSMKQLKLLEKFNKRETTEHGGDLSQGKRKTARPIAVKRAMHVVFRSDNAKGSTSFTRKNQPIRSILQKESKRFYVNLYKVAICGNHIHMCVKAKTKEGFKNFLRATSGQIAKLSKIKLWSTIPYTRIIDWGKAFKQVIQYVHKNELETLGLIAYTPRKRKRPQVNF